MKRVIVFTIILMFTIILFAGIVYAGAWEIIKDKISGAAVYAVISVVIGIAGVFVKGIYDINKAKKALVEITQAVNEYTQAKDEKSPGGKKITSNEWGKIGKEGMEAILAVLYALPVKWQKKMGLESR